jgi:hypothetical protein
MTRRLDSEQWSIAECLAHLNLSSEAFLLVMRDATEEAHRNGIVGNGPFKMDLRGRAVRWLLKPPPRIKFRTTNKLEPVIIGPPENILPRFLGFQRDLRNLIERVDGLDLNRTMLVSPFSKHIRYNLFSGFEIILTHQLRHLWQAEHVKRAILRDR